MASATYNVRWYEGYTVSGLKTAPIRDLECRINEHITRLRAQDIFQSPLDDCTLRATVRRVDYLVSRRDALAKQTKKSTEQTKKSTEQIKKLEAAILRLENFTSRPENFIKSGVDDKGVRDLEYKIECLMASLRIKKFVKSCFLSVNSPSHWGIYDPIEGPEEEIMALVRQRNELIRKKNIELQSAAICRLKAYMESDVDDEEIQNIKDSIIHRWAPEYTPNFLSIYGPSRFGINDFIILGFKEKVNSLEGKAGTLVKEFNALVAQKKLRESQRPREAGPESFPQPLALQTNGWINLKQIQPAFNDAIGRILAQVVTGTFAGALHAGYTALKDGCRPYE